MNMNDFYNTGSDILDAVNDAVSRNDFSELNATIKKTVQEVSQTIQRDVREYSRMFSTNMELNGWAIL